MPVAKAVPLTCEGDDSLQITKTRLLSIPGKSITNGSKWDPLYTVTCRSAQAKLEEQGVNLPSHLR